MLQDQLQAQRFERKYFLTERQATRVRDFISSRLQLDENSKNRPGHRYPVHSLYLDSHELATYWATVHCEKKRFKLRVRFYDDAPEAPIYFEIKRRENESIMKQRGAVHREIGSLLLAGHLPGPEHLVYDRPQDLGSLQRFVHLMQRLHAHPVVHIGYEREAWKTPEGNSVRVTFDTEVRGEAQRDATFTTRMASPVFPFGNQTVLELKFTDRFPDWLGDMVRHLKLVQTGAPKYCGSVALGGEQRIISAAFNARRQTLEMVSRFS